MKNIFLLFLNVTKISVEVSGRVRLIQRHSWPEGDFIENTRASQRVDEILGVYVDKTYSKPN